MASVVSHSSIRYLTGDATAPEGPRAVIAHVCNDAGGWGAGFVKAISARWAEPEAAYRRWHRAGTGFELGATQLVVVPPTRSVQRPLEYNEHADAERVDDERDHDEGLWVANMVAQHGYTRPGAPAIRYDALAACLGQLAQLAGELGASVHMPRLGCGLAGGHWGRVGPIVEEKLAGLDVVVYDLS